MMSSVTELLYIDIQIMHSRFQLLTKSSWKIQGLLEFDFSSQPTNVPFVISRKIHPFLIRAQNYHHHQTQISTKFFKSGYASAISSNGYSDSYIENEAVKIQAILKLQSHKSVEDIQQSLAKCTLSLSEELVLNVLKRHRSDWKVAYAFFGWVINVKNSHGFFPNTCIFNEMLDILGRMKRFEELSQVLDEMSKRKNLIDERTYGVVTHRYASAHKVEEAVEFFYKRKEFGLQQDLIGFQTLLLSLCRYKHVEEAELLFHNKRSEFRDDIKTWNIILNGWCVLGSLPDAKRFWKIIMASRCKPDIFTCGIYINALSKSGKISSAVKLFRSMQEKGCWPDVAICNCIIDGLCFKKRISEALAIFREMNGMDCSPNVATYNSLIKHLCKIRRMEKVYELLDEMEDKGGYCLPNALTYSHLLKNVKKPEEVDKILGRMEKSGCALLGDTYNLILRLFVHWGDEKRVKDTWDGMERSGLGPDQRSYTIMVHGLYEKGRTEDALSYYIDMVSKGMMAEPRTKLLVDAMNTKLKEGE